MHIDGLTQMITLIWWLNVYMDLTHLPCKTLAHLGNRKNGIKGLPTIIVDAEKMYFSVHTISPNHNKFFLAI